MRIYSRLLFLFLIVGVSLALYFTATRAGSRLFISIARRESARGDLVTAEKWINRSLGWRRTALAYQVLAEINWRKLKTVSVDEFALAAKIAVAAAAKAVEMDSGNYHNWLTAGLIYDTLAVAGVAGSEERARAAFKKARSLAPTAPEIPSDSIGSLFQFGFLKYQAGDYPAAARVLERALALDPNFANARYFLGLSYDRLGRKAAALEEFLAIQRFNPDHSGLKQIINNLQQDLPALNG